MVQLLIFFVFVMFKRKLGSLSLLSFILVALLAIVSYLLFSLIVMWFWLDTNPIVVQKAFLWVFVCLFAISILWWIPFGIVKILNSKWAFSIWEINRFSRAEAKKKFWLFFLFILTYLAINILLGEVLDPDSKNPVISNIWGVVSLLVSVLFTLWITNISLIVVWWEKLKYSDLFNKIKYFWYFLVSYIIYIIIVVWGFVLFIVPGIYRATRFSFYQYFILDKKYSPKEALKASRAITKGKFRDVFSYTLILWLINILWFMCFMVWLLWTFPMTMVARAKMYKVLTTK